jgi:hypothetical protein
LVTIDSLERHKDALEIKHRELDKEIKVLYKQYSSDETLKELKLKKLDLKHEIESINNRIEEMNNGKEN